MDKQTQSDINITPEMFVELQECLDRYVSEGDRLLVDELYVDSIIPRRQVLLVNSNITTILKQTITPKTGERSDVSQSVVPNNHIPKIIEFIEANNRNVEWEEPEIGD